MKINDFNYFWHNLFKRLYRKKAPKKEVKAPKKRSIVSEKKKYSLRKKEKSPKKRSIDSEKE